MIANAKKTNGKPTAVAPAVGYCRMSTDRQDKSIAEQRTEIEKLAARIMYGIKQEGKHQFLIDISRNTLRVFIKMAQNGGRNGRPAYGYDRMLVDEHGEHRLSVVRAFDFIIDRKCPIRR